MPNIYVAKTIIIDRILNYICESNNNFIHLFKLKELLEKDFYYATAQDYVNKVTNKKDLILETIYWEKLELSKQEIETRAKILGEKYSQQT